MCQTNGSGVVVPGGYPTGGYPTVDVGTECLNAVVRRALERPGREFDVGVKVQVEAGMAQQPGVDRPRLVRGGIVQHEVHVEVAGHRLVNGDEEL